MPEEGGLRFIDISLSHSSLDWVSYGFLLVRREVIYLTTKPRLGSVTKGQRPTRLRLHLGKRKDSKRTAQEGQQVRRMEVKIA